MANAPKPPVEEVRGIAQGILAKYGEQISELFFALDDLIWDQHEPYQRMSAPQRAAWCEAVRAELQEGYEG